MAFTLIKHDQFRNINIHLLIQNYRTLCLFPQLITRCHQLLIILEYQQFNLKVYLHIISAT